MAGALAALFVIVLLVAAPGAGQPFTSAKVLAGTAGPALMVLWAMATGRLRWRVPAGLAIALAAFAGAMGLAAVRGGTDTFSWLAFLLSGPILLILILGLAESEALRPARGLAWAAAIVATIAILQRAGFDPWRLTGWAPAAAYGSPRMRAYATLGNPNFVASVLAVALPWTFVVWRGAWVRALMFALLVGGLLATGSRVGIVAAGAGLACLAWPRPATVSNRLPSFLAVVAALVLAIAVSERAVGESVAGRTVPLRVAWPHVLERPMLGHGLGAVARDYAAWQAMFFADSSRASLMPFAGDFDHLHHEPLEWLIETGLVGVTAWGAIVVLALRAGAGSGQASRRVALAALAAVAVVSLADFPLHRPADHLAAWLALSVAARTR